MIPWLTRISRRMHGRVGFQQRPIAGDENWFKRGFLLGHADASITLRVYAHYLPDPSLKDVDLLDTQPSATPAQPAEAIAASEDSEVAELFGKSGDAHFRELEPAGAVATADGGASVPVRASYGSPRILTTRA